MADDCVISDVPSCTGITIKNEIGEKIKEILTVIKKLYQDKKSNNKISSLDTQADTNANAHIVQLVSDINTTIAIEDIS